ncbi:hypothetical protein ACQ4M3_01160 [Leptolyngbya sp. AN03gr2]|uniref:hypothetical protein n=1 Tax=unclassified Leptolyngbya TaxID=2650499 RepID=UPI003D319E8B
MLRILKFLFPDTAGRITPQDVKVILIYGAIGTIVGSVVLSWLGSRNHKSPALAPSPNIEQIRPPAPLPPQNNDQ